MGHLEFLDWSRRAVVCFRKRYPTLSDDETVGEDGPPGLEVGGERISRVERFVRAVGLGEGAEGVVGDAGGQRGDNGDGCSDEFGEGIAGGEVRDPDIAGTVQRNAAWIVYST